MTDSTVPGWSIGNFYVYSFVRLQSLSDTGLSRLSFPPGRLVGTFHAFGSDFELHLAPAESAAEVGLIEVGTGTTNFEPVTDGLLRRKARFVDNLLGSLKRALKERFGATFL